VGALTCVTVPSGTLTKAARISIPEAVLASQYTGSLHAVAAGLATADAVGKGDGLEVLEVLGVLHAAITSPAETAIARMHR